MTPKKPQLMITPQDVLALTISEAAALIRFGEDQVRVFVSSGRLPHCRIDGEIRILRDDLDNFLKANRIADSEMATEIAKRPGFSRISPVSVGKKGH